MLGGGCVARSKEYYNRLYGDRFRTNLHGHPAKSKNALQMLGHCITCRVIPCVSHEARDGSGQLTLVVLPGMTTVYHSCWGWWPLRGQISIQPGKDAAHYQF